MASTEDREPSVPVVTMRRGRILILLGLIVALSGLAIVLMLRQKADVLLVCLGPLLTIALSAALARFGRSRIEAWRDKRVVASRLAQGDSIWIRKGGKVISVSGQASRKGLESRQRFNPLPIVGVGSLVLAALVLWFGLRISHPDLSYEDAVIDLYPNAAISLAGLGFTILVLNKLYSHQQKLELRERAIRDFGSMDNLTAIRATETIRAEGWHRDGSLSRKPFQSADLHEANLRDYFLTGCMLGGANLRAADLTSSNLEGATLVACDLTGAKIEGSRLGGADLRGAEVSDDQLRSVHSLRKATMPDGKRYDGRYVLGGDIAVAKGAGKDLDDDPSMAGFYGVPVSRYRAWHGGARATR